ncbi:MAG: helix-turn-helix domain-containing protein [Ignavibacteria bacterium]|nr:helix-turn-helix domain-containing protein [Ignavibacteria bacterium]
MIASGQQPEQRIAFLERELERIIASANINVREASAEVLGSWGLADSATDIEFIRHRFQVHGHDFTFRESRNRLRRLGIQDNSIASPLLSFGLLMVSDDPQVAESLRNLIEPRVNSLLAHPDVVQSEEQYAEIMSRSSLLASDRERQVLNLGQEVFSRIGPDWVGSFSFKPSEFRDLAIVRGALLDLSMLDLIDAAIANGFMTEVRNMLLASIEDSILIYCQVVADVLGARIADLRSGVAPTISPLVPSITDTEPSEDAQSIPEPPPMGDSQSSGPGVTLLSVKQVQDLLGVSRITLRRMEKAGVLMPIRIGRAVRYDSSAIDQFLSKRR